MCQRCRECGGCFNAVDFKEKTQKSPADDLFGQAEELLKYQQKAAEKSAQASFAAEICAVAAPSSNHIAAAKVARMISVLRTSVLFF